MLAQRKIMGTTAVTGPEAGTAAPTTGRSFYSPTQRGGAAHGHVAGRHGHVGLFDPGHKIFLPLQLFLLFSSENSICQSFRNYVHSSFQQLQDLNDAKLLI